MTDRKDYILIVEDDPDIREALRDALEPEGYTVRTAENGQEALDTLAGSPRLPNLILLDLMMPVLDGWRFLKARAERPTWKEIPVVVTSSVAPDERKALDVTGYMRKPIRLLELLALVERYVKPDPGTTQAGPA